MDRSPKCELQTLSDLSLSVCFRCPDFVLFVLEIIAQDIKNDTENFPSNIFFQLPLAL